jgi:hypothetical protein
LCLLLNRKTETTLCRPERSDQFRIVILSAAKLSRLADVSEAGVCWRNPERVAEGAGVQNPYHSANRTQAHLSS